MEAIRIALPDVSVKPGDADDYLKPVYDTNPDLICLGYDQKLPRGVKLADLPCSTERIEAFEPEKYKSSFLKH
jgi:hypothetical protein